MSEARENLVAAIADLGITMVSTFVPWSQSRMRKERATVRDRSLNWSVRLVRDGREILTTDYTAGIGNAPSYRQGRMTLDVEAALVHETEKGTHANRITARKIEPDLCDVVYSLMVDASAIDHGTFEEWCSALGCNVDSRASEATYRTCLETGLKLRAALGDDGLTKLRNACQDY